MVTLPTCGKLVKLRSASVSYTHLGLLSWICRCRPVSGAGSFFTSFSLLCAGTLRAVACVQQTVEQRTVPRGRIAPRVQHHAVDARGEMCIRDRASAFLICTMRLASFTSSTRIWFM